MTEGATVPYSPGQPTTSSDQRNDPCDLLLANARVIDPESGVDGVRYVGITGGTITSVSPEPVPAHRTLDLSGLVLTPGFIDLHSHAQTITGLRLQALDGVTTSLELESGAMPVAVAYDGAAAQGRPVNYGYSASWALARMHVLDGVPLPSADGPESGQPVGIMQRHQRGPNWLAPAPRPEVDRILGHLREGVEQGALGFGVLVGYSPGSGRVEFYRMARLAGQLGVPLFVHGRFIAADDPGSAVEGVLELIAVAAATDVAVHLCHINSTYSHAIEEVAEAITTARAKGVRITTEMYPYAASSTGIGAAFLSPEHLRHRGMKTTAIRYLGTGERVASEDRLVELREKDPGGLCVIDFLDLDDAADRDRLYRCMTLPDTAFASDAMGLVSRSGVPDADFSSVWPLPEDAFAHPRSMGCFSRAIAHVWRELGLLSLPEVIRRCTLLPAQILGDAVPAMRAKGRIAVGADADITVFDADRIQDRATFDASAPSTGVEHVLVGGEFVVQNGELLPDALPGRPVLSTT